MMWFHAFHKGMNGRDVEAVSTDSTIEPPLYF